MPNIMPGFDKEIARMAQRLLINGRPIDYHTNVLATKVTPGVPGEQALLQLGGHAAPGPLLQRGCGAASAASEHRPAAPSPKPQLALGSTAGPPLPLPPPPPPRRRQARAG
jgi:hypothetical protein